MWALCVDGARGSYLSVRDGRLGASVRVWGKEDEAEAIAEVIAEVM